MKHPTPLEPTRRAPLWAALVCLSLALALPGCRDSVSATAEVAEPILQGQQLRFPEQHPHLRLLKLSEAQAGQTLDVSLSAKLVWDEARTQRLYPAFAGRVEQIHADLGQRVHAGQTLAELASPDFGAAQADAARARADQQLAHRQLLRQRELLEAGVIARRELEQAEADSARADAELARAEARVRLYGGNAQVNQRLQLRAGIGGVVVERNLNPGQELRPDQGGPGSPALFVISDPSSLWVQIDAREAELALLQPGGHFELEVPAWPGRRFKGQVMALADAIDPTTRTIKVRGQIANAEHLLKAEMLGSVHVPRPLGPGVVVPASALILRGEAHYVFVQVAPGRFEPRAVKLAMSGAREAVIAEGLKAGEKVVSDNVLLLARQFRMAEDAAQAGTPAPAASANRGA